MQTKAFFKAGLKIIGVLTIIWGLTQIIPVFLQFYSVYNQPDMMTDNDLRYYRFSLLFQAVYPLLLVIIGVYLLKSGKAILALAFRDSNEEYKDKTALAFILFMKLAGLVLLIYSIPKVFQMISNLMFVTSAYTVDTSEQTRFIVQNFAAAIIHLLLGLYLLKSGKFFYRLGFNKQENTNGEIK